MRAGGQQNDDDGRLQPCSAVVTDLETLSPWNINFPAFDRGFNHHRPGGQQHRINGSKIIILSMEYEENCEASQVAPAQRAVRLQTRRDEKCDQARNPDRSSERMNQQRLLEEILRQRQDHIATLGSNIAHQFDKRPVVMNVPEQVWQKNKKGREPTYPNPRIEKNAALLG